MDNIGTCKYCGESRIIVKADKMTQEDLDNQASLECDCEGAKAEQDILELIQSGKRSLDRIIGKKSKEVAKALTPFVEMIARKKIKKVSINFDGIMTGSLYASSSGKKITAETRETVVECSDGETVDALPPDEDGGRTESE